MLWIEKNEKENQRQEHHQIDKRLKYSLFVFFRQEEKRKRRRKNRIF